MLTSSIGAGAPQAPSLIGSCGNGDRVNTLQDDRAMRLCVGDLGVAPFVGWLLCGLGLGLTAVVGF